MELKSFFEDKEDDAEYLAIIIKIKDGILISNIYGDTIYDCKIYEIKEKIKSVTSKSVFTFTKDQLLLIDKKDNNAKKVNLKSYKRKIKKAIHHHEHLLYNKFFLEVILGIASGDRNNVVKNALIALEFAQKYDRKNFIYQKHIFIMMKEKLESKKNFFNFKNIIKNTFVFPFYQEIIDNKTGKVFKYEALARIVYDDFIITPDKFLKAISLLKLDSEFCKIMIEKVFNDIYEKDKIPAASVNINIKDIQNRNTCALIERELKKYGGKRITFEIIETLGIEDYNQIRNFVSMIKKYGATVSIDDFGSGHSGYEHIANLDVDYIKIDGKFTKELKTNKKVENLLKNLNEFCKSHGIKIIVEYVEDEETYEILKDIGIDYSQGYYFGKPLMII